MIRAVLACDGEQAHQPCRQAAPVGVVATANQARRVARSVHGWSARVDVLSGDVADLCPSCTRRAQEGR